MSKDKYEALMELRAATEHMLLYMGVSEDRVPKATLAIIEFTIAARAYLDAKDPQPAERPRVPISEDWKADDIKVVNSSLICYVKGDSHVFREYTWLVGSARSVGSRVAALVEVAGQAVKIVGNLSESS